MGTYQKEGMEIAIMKKENYGKKDQAREGKAGKVETI